MKGQSLNESPVTYRLGTVLGRVVFALAIALVVLPLGYEAARMETSAVLSAFEKQADIRKAIAFDPENPRLYEQMGRMDQAEGNASATESVRWFRKAADLDPRDGLYWESLGQACQFAGDERCATNAFSRALFLDPMAPRALWLAANHDLFSGASGQAASRFRRLLAMDPGYAGAVFAICLRAYGDPQFIGERVLPADSSPALKLAYVNFLSAQNEFQAAARFWSELISSHAPFRFSMADPYLERLISSGRIGQAARVWQNLQHSGILAAGGGGNTGNLVFNPGFERDPLNAGFGWRFKRISSVNAAFGDPSAHHGARSLRIDYVIPENRASEPVYQLIPVAPGRTYRLAAWVRTQAIGSDSGPRLRVVDPQHAGCLQAQTPDAVGTTTWHQVSTTFTTCPQTNLIRLSLWRPRSDGSPAATGGHFWLDDVRLELEQGSSLPLPRNANP
ncbi:MAG TPA: carbohydrate binding domain-containing protein [Candidatus Dormibacteraeota bacterium]|nr:carbohydrate binding domain-containing protein [Candidatus Dormibacteraeota bacterium]